LELVKECAEMPNIDNRSKLSGYKSNATKKGLTKKAKILEHIKQLTALNSLQFVITQKLEREVKKD
jgi:hypothetical protein